ncbi:zinc finger A20 and AN1 domain-containing stress-associated protein 6-like [Impatiens glandulifera]|uniref:zinc finger A20 and AN1 domain-containing stress-associated protein 6-like n=1 Tax=Impatiens glandulifera TaxID=253017 RepID=UPI001FB086B8|nr:zinc finger A20 and AN1 domain-containing stress-associated protein 6-like [Impatiens glandulifera]
MAEEHEFQSPEGHHLCANNCGFFGIPATLNLCSKCYRDHQLKENQAKSAISAVQNSLLPPPPSSSSNTVLAIEKLDRFVVVSSPAEEEIRPAVTVNTNRCSACSKRVGLTGFTCRCGFTYCGIHRYPEGHGCSFDYKSAGKHAIARENPVVKANKLEKI